MTSKWLRGGWFGALSVLVSLLASAVVSAAAFAESPTVASSGTVTTVTFTYTGDAQSFVVPVGVTSLQIVASGADGGYGGQSPGGGYKVAAIGGAGARASDTMSVTPGATYVVQVGGMGGNASLGAAGQGGYNGGGPAGAHEGGGGGGGASSVCLAPLGMVVSPAECLIVAGGGGGAGGNGKSGQGGFGGAAEQAGSRGEGSGGQGGQPGTASAGGSGGAGDQLAGLALAGRLGTGGAGGEGPRVSGGGGGGGLYGGGGGGAGGQEGEGYAGGGGGGGSSYAPGGVVTYAGSRGETAQVTISYSLPTPPSGTTGPPGGGTSTVGSPKPPPIPDARLLSRVLTASFAGIISTEVTCPAAESVCTGTITLRTMTAVTLSASRHEGKARRRSVLTLATSVFSVMGGRGVVVRLRLSTKARALLARTHVLRARATIEARDPLGATHAGQTIVSLRSAKAKHGSR